MKKFFTVLLIIVSAFWLFSCASEELPAIECSSENYVVPYYIKELRTGVFHYPNAEHISENKINLYNDDKGYCTFEDDFKKFTVCFYDQAGTPCFIEFVVTNFSQEKGKATADLVNIGDGVLRRYTLTTDADYIYVNTEVTYWVLVDTEREGSTPLHISREDTLVMKFSRVKPKYIV